MYQLFPRIMATFPVGIPVLFVCLVFSTVTQAQVADNVGDVANPCIDIIRTDISASAETITATLWLAGYFCPKAQYQFHVDIDHDGESDFEFMAKYLMDETFSFHGYPGLEVEVDGTGFAIAFNTPSAIFAHENGTIVDEVSVWFRTHLVKEADQFPDKFAAAIDLPLGGEVLKVVGNEGGMVVDGDPASPTFGTYITIPPGSLSEPVGISIKYEPGLSLPRNPDKQLIAEQPAFTILPDDLIFDSPVTISVPIPDMDGDGLVDDTLIPSHAGSIFFLNGAKTEWVGQDTVMDLNGGFLKANSSHFSTWAPSYGRWQVGSQVNYWIESLPTELDFATFRVEFAQAAQQWAGAVDDKVQFFETAVESDADVKVRARDFCSDGEQCEAYTRTTIDVLTENWNLDFNTAKGTWVSGPYGAYDPNSGSVPFLRAALRELGRLMGVSDYSEAPYAFVNSAENGREVIMFDDVFLPDLNLRAWEHLDLWDINAVKALYDFDPCDLHYPDPVAQFNGPAYRYKDDRDRYRISITNRHYYWDMFEPVTNDYCTGPEVPWNDNPISRSWTMMDVSNWPEKDESFHYCGISFLTGAYFMENEAFGGTGLILDHRDNSVLPAPESVSVELWDNKCQTGYVSNSVYLQ